MSAPAAVGGGAVSQRSNGATPTGSSPDGPPTRVVLAGVVAVLIVGVVLRFAAHTALWLDEAITIQIARLPLADIGGALRHDGHPPLYYFLLHGWMDLFGTGDVAVRALSGVLSLAALPLMWAAGRRLGGRTTATIALLLLASSPFAIRYATEARMYSLVTLLALGGYLAVVRALEAPRPLRLGLVALISAALVLTHYWDLYLTASAVVVLAVIAWRDPARRAAAGRIIGAIAVGWLAFLPWLSSFLDQARHTGTPWGRTLNPIEAIQRLLFVGFGGGKWPVGLLLGPFLAALAVAAIVDRRSGGLTLRGPSSRTGEPPYSRSPSAPFWRASPPPRSRRRPSRLGTPRGCCRSCCSPPPSG